MASRPSIVFLFDLDLHSVHWKTTVIRSRGVEEETDVPISSPVSLIREFSLNILNFFHEKQDNIQWGYRFYSSSNYCLNNKARFTDLTTQTVEEFEEALNLKFEQNGVPDGASFNQMSGAGVLNRTLQDIISDFDWKTPSDSLTPTRRGKKAGRPLADQHLQNLVFIFTRVPSESALGSFCQLAPDEVSLKAVSDLVLPRELTKRFQELQLSLNFVDLSGSHKPTFSKMVGSLRGAVISSAALKVSPFGFSQILQASCSADDGSIEECASCQFFRLGPKVVLSISPDSQIDFDVQCWNQTCSRSSLSLEDANVHNSVINCVPVVNTAMPTRHLLQLGSLYLLTSRGPLTTSLWPVNVSWVGCVNGRVCFVSTVSAQTALLLFPPTGCCSFQHFFCTHSCDVATCAEDIHHTQQVPSVQGFVARLIKSERDNSQEYASSPVVTPKWARLNRLRGNYGDKKTVPYGTHWQMLSECFQKEEPSRDRCKEANRNCFDQLAHHVVPLEAAPNTSTNNEAVPKKVGSSRIQNLRASTLLLKSQEVRARTHRMEQEKDDKEKQMASERKEKMWKEQQAYLQVLRASVFTGDDWIRLVPDVAAEGESKPKPHAAQEVLERCLQLKSQGLTSQLEDWQWMCIVQVIVSSILYVWKDAESLPIAIDTLCKNFLKKPSAVNRTTTKETKAYEFKFQIILRLELLWSVQSLAGEEEDVLQDATSLFQLLSIHTSPKIMSGFYQDALIFNYEGMLAEFLVSLGEELNQPIPASLSEEVSRKASARSPSPALSSKTLSVKSMASQQEVVDSQRPNSRDLRSRTLSRQPSLNVMQHKKQIALPTKAAEKVPVVAKKEETTEVGRVRRSLHFGAETPTRLPKPRASKTPTKGSTPRRLETSFQPLLDLTTPSKATDVILAPETPSRLRSGGKSGRKTDGVHVVGESPDIKQETVLRRSPRRLQAAMALRRRASFYSSLSSDLNPEKGASRNWSRAESQVWSDKAKANVSLKATADENNSPQLGQSAHFLFSKILSRNDSTAASETVFSSPSKNVLSSDTLPVMPSLNTPKKGDLGLLRPPTTPSFHKMIVPDSSGKLLAPGTPLKTPLKTPKQVQFNLQHQPATPSSKTLPSTRSILKSPMTFKSPAHQNCTPRKLEREREEPQMLHLLDETSLSGRNQLELVSPVKDRRNSRDVENETIESTTRRLSSDSRSDDLVRKLDEDTLRPDEEVKLQSPVKFLPLRPTVDENERNFNNFGSRIENWMVVDPRLPRISANKGATPNDAVFDFNEELEAEESRSGLADSSTHKRKLFQSNVTPRSVKRRRINLSPERKTPTRAQFQPLMAASVFHLENSPIVSPIQAKSSK